LKYEDVKKFIEEKEGYILLSATYEYATLPLTIQCPKGHIFEQSFSAFSGGQRCPTCARDKLADARRLTFDHVKSVIESAEGYVLLSTSYHNTSDKLKIRCPDGHIFEKSYDHFYRGQRCPICQESKGEAAVKDYLTYNNISFARQHSFPDCRNIEPLRFDFAVYDYSGNLSLLVEYDGEYHYIPIDGKRKLKYQQKLDNIKNIYCHRHSIPLLRIPYTQFDNIEVILSKELSKCNLLPHTLIE